MSDIVDRRTVEDLLQTVKQTTGDQTSFWLKKIITEIEHDLSIGKPVERQSINQLMFHYGKNIDIIRKGD